MTPTDFEGLLRRLLDGGVDFILIGGVAAAVHRAARATYDLDVVYDRSPKLIELKRAAGRPKDHEALAELEPLRDERGR